jgi:hypothetical protein
MGFGIRHKKFLQFLITACAFFLCLLWEITGLKVRIDQRKIKWKMKKKTHTHAHTHTRVAKIADTQCTKWATKYVMRSPSLSSHKRGECCCRIESRYVWVTHFFMICCIRFLCFGQLSKWNVHFPLSEWWQTRHAIQISSILWWIMWAGAAACDMDCRTWVKDYHRYMCELRTALRAHVPDNKLRLLVEVGRANKKSSLLKYNPK